MTETQSRTGPRRYRTPDEAEQLVAAFETSGLTRREFCAGNDVALNTLTRYLRKHRAAPAAGHLVEVEVAETISAVVELSVLLRVGRRIEVRRGFDIPTLQQVVAALERC